MHQSRLKVVLFDTPEANAQAGVEFWSAALGGEPGKSVTPDDPYARVGYVHNTVDAMVQRIDGEPRIHIDIETDDLDSEVSRLETLGAERVEFVESWWVMKAPSGHIFCVVPIHSGDFPEGANRWE